MSEFHITWKWRPGRDNVVADALSHKQEDLMTVRKKVRASREGTLIDPADIAGVLRTCAKAAPVTPTKDPTPTKQLTEKPTNEERYTTPEGFYLTREMIEANRDDVSEETVKARRLAERGAGD